MIASDTPRTQAKYAEVYAGDDYEAVEKLNEFAQQLERELNAANERIRRLEEAGDRLFWMAPPGLKYSRVVNAKAAWTKAKEAKP